MKILLLLLVPFMVQAQTAKTLKAANGQTIGFIESVPDGNKRPLIIFLHGWDEKGNGTTDINLVKRYGYPDILKNAGKDFIILAPQLSKGEGFWPLWYVNEMLKYAKENLNVDTSQMILTGLSLGASTVIWYGYTQPERFSALVPMAAPCYYGEPAATRTITAPVWAFVGEKDEIATTWCTARLKDYIPNFLLTVYPGGDHGSAWIKGYADPGLYSWMRLQRKIVPVEPLPVEPPVTPPPITPPITPNVRQVEWIPIGGVPVIDSNYNLINGTYKVELRITFGGLVFRDTVSVTIADSAYNTECNILPTAEAGPDQTIKLGITGTLKGSGIDQDGTIKYYKWTKIKGPTRGKISYSTRSTTTLTGLVEGTYIYQLKVTDDKAGAAIDTVTVNVVK